MATTASTNGESDLIRFSNPEKVWALTEEMQKVERDRAWDRAIIDNLFNGGRPYTPEEVKKHSISINVNWLEAPRLAQEANRQLNNATLHPGALFTCTCDDAPLEQREEWSINFTKLLHEPLQRGRTGRRHHFLIRTRNASVALHGVGPILWANDFDWLGRFVSLEDLLIPTDTYCDFSNMRYFAVNLYLTPGELVDMTQRDKADKGWNKKMVRQLLDNLLRNFGSGDQQIDWVDRPEHAAEVNKQNRGYLYSDAVPKARLRAFYFQDAETQKWYRRIVLRENVGDMIADSQKDFIYDAGDTVFSDRIEKILNVQYGDTNLVAPLKYHSVRGVGTALYAAAETMNRLRCEFVQHVFEQMKMYFKIQDPSDRDRLKQVVLQQYGFIPEGLNIVRRDERHQIDAALVESAMNQMRQVMQENSSSFVQDAAAGEEKQMTAKEAMIRLNQSNVMISGMLQMMYVQEGFYYEELLRRFLLKDSADPTVKRFQAKCIESGIPPRYLEAHRWQITPERVLGGGDRTQAQAEAMFLLQQLPLLEPQAKQRAKRWAFTAVLNDPDKGRALIPEAPVTTTSGTVAAEGRFGSLMQGIKLTLLQGIEQQDYIKSLLRLAITKLLSEMESNPTGTPELVRGLAAVLADVQAHLQIVAEDKSNSQFVKIIGDVIGKIGNEIKAMVQRQQEAQGAGGQGMDGLQAETAGKIQAELIKAKSKAELSKAMGILKMQQKQQQFEQRMAQDKQRHALDSELEIAGAQTEALVSGLTQPSSVER